MDSWDRLDTLKRRRTTSSMSDDDEPANDKSKAWDDPSVLEEMGLGILGSDVYTSDEGELKELLECPSSDSDDFSENIDVKKGAEAGRQKKKRKIMDPHREPLKEQQKLVGTQLDESQLKKEDAKLEKIKPASCVIKNSQVKYGKEDFLNKSEIEEREKKCTEQVCNSEFKLSRLSMKDRASESAKDYLTGLADELILTILTKLDRRSVVQCCLVSRRLNRVASDESLWTRVDLGGRTLPPSALGHMMRRGPFFVRLASACIKDPVSYPKLLPKHFVSKIQYLDLSNASISQKSLATFLGYCARLKKLSVENCAVSNDVADAIASNRGLEVLNLAMCMGISTQGLSRILTQCNRLQSLNIAWTHLTGTTIDMVSRTIPSTVERLNISGCRKNITDQNVIDMLVRCDSLVELDVSDCIELTDETINFIVEHVSGLEYLAISRCYSIPLTSLPSLKKVPSVTYLDLFGLCTDSELKQLKARLDDKTLNQFTFSSVARPTVGLRRTSIWGLRVRD